MRRIVTMVTATPHAGSVKKEMMSATKKNKENQDASDPSESDDDFRYEEVSLDEEWRLQEGEEDLEAMVKAIHCQGKDNAWSASATGYKHQPEATDEFLRNFLLQTGMTETLDCFQTEWAEMAQKGPVCAEQVPDVYADNRRLHGLLENAKRERDEHRRAASAAAETLGRMRSSRDLHQRQHKRVVQEKNRLIQEMRKLKVQCDNYEPVLKRMNEKYQAVLKQTAVATLERDKALGRVEGQLSTTSASVGMQLQED